MKVVDFVSDCPTVWEILTHLSGERAFDIGANGGLLASALAPNFKQVVAVEPHPDSFDHLSRNIPRNVIAMNGAVSEVPGAITLVVASTAESLGEYVSGSSLAETWGDEIGTVTVPATTLDHLTDRFGPPDLVKIDTEGHEQKVVRGGLRTFDEHNPRFVIEIHEQSQGEWIRGRLGGEVVRHPAYGGSGYLHDNHYWLVST